MFGDINQCSSVEGGSAIHYNYDASATILNMCGENRNCNILKIVVDTI